MLAAEAVSAVSASTRFPRRLEHNAPAGPCKRYCGCKDRGELSEVRVTRAQAAMAIRYPDVLDRIEHAAVATVSPDGRPWNTPVYFARRGDSFYWISRRDAQHSTNIRHNGRAFVVVFDS